TRERDRADRMSDFMTGMFKVSDPSEARGNSITAREILDKASKDIDTGLAKDPELQARLMYTMGNVYLSLGLDTRAQSLLERAIAIQRRVLGLRDPDTLGSISSLANTLFSEGRYPEAEKLQRDTLEIRRRLLGPQHPDTLSSMHELGLTLAEEGHYAEAEKLDRETLDIYRRVFGPEHPSTLGAVNSLGNLMLYEAKFPEAEKLY